MESMDIFHGIHEHCPWNPWNMWAMSMDSMESMDNVQGTVGIVHGIFPASLHKGWTLSMDIVHCRPWTFSIIP